MTATRHFLGWDRPPLAQAAEWLEAKYGKDMRELVVALPGTRAAHRLQELLALRMPGDWHPPRLLTQGQLTDEVVQLDRPLAGRLARTLFWERALARLSPRKMGALVREAHQLTAFSSRLRLAEALRSLHGDLAAEGLDFSRLTRSEAEHQPVGENERWKVLAQVQKAWRELLVKSGQDDPHEARFRAIREGRLDRSREIVLVGVADMNHLLSRVLEEIGAGVTALVVAPESEAEGFDQLGRLVPAYWQDHDVPLDPKDWYVVERPVDQADRLVQVLTEWGRELAAPEITIGVPDDEVLPYLERRLGETQVRTRSAAGTPLSRSRPYQLLRAARRYLEQRSFPALAELARHPDLGPVFSAAQGLYARDPAAALDDYQRAHLPGQIDGLWVEDGKTTQAVRTIHAALNGALGPLARKEKRPLLEWQAAIHGFLAKVYGDLELDTDRESDERLANALQSCLVGLEEVAGLPPMLAQTKREAHEALDIVLRHLRPGLLPAPPPRTEEETIELLGWLELFLDDTPAVLLTGFNEGRVPHSVQTDPFLPNSARRRLGLSDNDSRLARDVYAANVLLHTRARTAFVTGRRSLEGDPLQPSRLAFHCGPEKTVERVRKFLSSEDNRPRLAAPQADPAPGLPRLPEPVSLPSIRVSSFRRFLESPYGFYLEQVLRLRTLDDNGREMDPLGFGILTHDVLEDFGRSDLADSSAPEAIATFLVDRVDARIEQTFGSRPLPAVALQGEQLKFRLRQFAARQAQHRREGWRIVHVEWEPPPEARFLRVDDGEIELRARIDRIDFHPSRGWAILDYKTSEDPKSPEKVHRRRDGSWMDLQLPLYAHLTRDLTEGNVPKLGYFSLGKDEQRIDFQWVHKWDRGDLDEALECARDVVRRVRREELFELGSRRPYEEILQAIYGDGLWSEEAP